MDASMDDYSMKFLSPEYKFFRGEDESEDQCCSFEEEYFLIKEKNENEFGFFTPIKEAPKHSSDAIKTIKNINSKFPKFQSHCFFNPKLKDDEQITIKNKRLKKKNIQFLSRKTNRKGMKDNIIKKIKSRFFKAIKNILKEKLQIRYKYKRSFKYLPQKFISNIKKENNRAFWEETLLEFFKGKLKSDNKALELLKEDKIGEIKLKDLFNDYLNSQEFQESIPNSENERNVDQNYIDDYINYSKEFINYFTEEKKVKK